MAFGEGPGHITPDGCAVDVYAALPAGRESELIAAAVPAFDAVLLCSHLINTSDREQRDAFVAASARHVAPSGCVIIERHDPGWFDAAEESSSVMGGVEVSLVDISRPGPGLLAATVVYRLDGPKWWQTFVAERVDDQTVNVVLARHGLVLDRFLDADRTWIRAVRASERKG